MTTEKEAFAIWEKVELEKSVREHCKAVQEKALEITNNLLKQEISVDVELIKIGALLHDVGRTEKHSVNHGLLGYRILKKNGIDEKICKIARNHVGAGISKEEAMKLNLPIEDYLPETLEEKIIAYADNLVENYKIVPYKKVLAEWGEKFGFNSEQVFRLKLLHSELTDFVTSEEMMQMEQQAGVSVAELMENAGKGIAKIISKRFQLNEKKVLVFCGPGNNGGDGLVATRYLKKKEVNVEVFIFDEPKSEESKANLNNVVESGIKLNVVSDPEVLEKFDGSIVIDALLGTGIKGEVREPLASVIQRINKMDAFKVSVDIPSGINPDTGKESNVFVKPDLILTLHKFKKGLVGRYKLGKVLILDIGIPK